MDSTAGARALMVGGEVACQSGGRAWAARGMPVMACDGEALGRVAAVLRAEASAQVAHLVLDCGRDRLVYRLLPADWVHRIDAGTMTLTVSAQAALQQPVWHADP